MNERLKANLHVITLLPLRDIITNIRIKDDEKLDMKKIYLYFLKYIETLTAFIQDVQLFIEFSRVNFPEFVPLVLLNLFFMTETQIPCQLEL